MTVPTGIIFQILKKSIIIILVSHFLSMLIEGFLDFFSNTSVLYFHNRDKIFCFSQFLSTWIPFCRSHSPAILREVRIGLARAIFGYLNNIII